MHDGTPPALVTRAPQIAAAKAAVEGAKVSEGQAQLALDRAILRMPFDGRVVSKMVELGQRVAPGGTLLTIEKVDDLEVRLTIPHSDLGFIDLGLSGAGAKKLKLIVSAEIGGKTYSWRAAGSRTVPMLDSRNPVVTLIATLLGPVQESPGMEVSSLLPGLFVTASRTFPSPRSRALRCRSMAASSPSTPTTSCADSALTSSSSPRPKPSSRVTSCRARPYAWSPWHRRSR
jgi:multidrug efflux pump subunit AcrA (membrane-fusion protein)